jgi:hypothetical protein
VHPTHHRYTGGWSLAQAAMTLFEANGHGRSDALAVNSYGVSPRCILALLR